MRPSVALPATVLLALLLELLARGLLRHRVRTLLGRVATPTARLEVTLPRRPVLPRLLAGRVNHVVIACARLGIPGLQLRQVAIELRALRLGRRGAVIAGEGTLAGRIPAAEVLALAGVPGALELREGQATLRWPAPGSRLPSVGLRLRPQLDGRRVRLLPTPLSLTLPPLPAGVHLTAVEAREDAMLVTADLDLPVLLTPT